jgi:predicted alpha/beta superfamily hydrolase
MKTYLITLSILLSINYLSGQNPESFGVRSVTIPSKILSEEREILIFNARGKEYAQGPNQLPTIFLLDGRENLLLTAGILSNLVRADQLPDVNLIGINTYDYNREYNLSTKSTSDEIGFESGGADDFEKFILNELFPYVSSSVSISKYRLLIGHSLGGSFGLKMMLENPESFSSAIFADASLWWNDAELIEKYKNESGKGIKNTTIYYSRAGREPENIRFFDEFEALAKSSNNRFDRFPGEDHITTLTPAIFYGLKYIFSDFSSLEELYAANDFTGIKIKLNSLNAQYDTQILPKVPPIAAFARGLTREGRYAESVDILQYLKQFHPRSIMVLNFLGEAYEKSGDLAKAKETYTESLEVAEAAKSPMIRWIQRRLTEVRK